MISGMISVLRTSRLSNFVRLFTATTITNTGDGIRFIALPLLAASLTHDAVLISAVAAVSRAPWLLASLFAGVLADRHDRRYLMGFGSLGQALLVGLLAIAVAVHAVTILLVIAIAFVMGCLEVVIDNTAQVIIPNIVPSEKLEVANSRMAGAFIVANEMGGPPLGGALYGITKVLPFVADAGSFALAGGLLLSMRGRFRAGDDDRDDVEDAEQGKTSILAGMNWLRQHRQLLTLALASSFQNIFANAGLAIMVLYVLHVLKLNGTGFGVLTAAGSVGGLIGSVTGGRVVQAGRAKAVVVGSNLLMGLSAAGIGLTNLPVIAGTLLATNGFAIVVWNVVTVTIRQRSIPQELLGRVNSAYRMIAWAGIPVGALIGGAIANAWGPQVPFLIEGAALIAFSGALFLLVEQKRDPVYEGT